MPEPFLKLEDVSKSYDSVVDGPPVRVLDGISMSVIQGETAAYVRDQMGHSSIKVTFDT